MTTNDAYIFAKKIYRKHYTNRRVESLMKDLGYSEEDTKKVKTWLGKWTNGMTSY